MLSLSSRRYLWLNFHTIHHLFPRLDVAHHPAAQKLLLETCKEFGVRYEAAGSAWSVYKEMIHSFANPRSLYKEILVYGGGL